MKTLLILLLSFDLYSQNIDYLKSQDTLYLVLSVSDNPITVKKSNISYSVGGNGITNIYNFNDSENGRISLQTFNNQQGYGVYSKKVRTSKFMKENKERIIDLDFIDKHGLGKVFVDIIQRPNRKVIYIINSKDLDRRKMIIKRTPIEDSYFSEM